MLHLIVVHMLATTHASAAHLALNMRPAITADRALSTREVTSLSITPADVAVRDRNDGSPDDFTLTLRTGSNIAVGGETVRPALRNPKLYGKERCNDGTPFTFFIEKGYDGEYQSKNWVIYLKGGLFCDDDAYLCSERERELTYCSSDLWARSSNTRRPPSGDPVNGWYSLAPMWYDNYKSRGWPIFIQSSATDEAYMTAHGFDDSTPFADVDAWLEAVQTAMTHVDWLFSSSDAIHTMVAEDGGWSSGPRGSTLREVVGRFASGGSPERVTFGDRWDEIQQMQWIAGIPSSNHDEPLEDVAGGIRAFPDIAAKRRVAADYATPEPRKRSSGLSDPPGEGNRSLVPVLGRLPQLSSA